MWLIAIGLEQSVPAHERRVTIKDDFESDYRQRVDAAGSS